MEKIHPLNESRVPDGKGYEVGPGLYYYTNRIVNIVFVGFPETGRWSLVDAGMPGSADEIINIAEARFGKGTKPEGILLTHGHFDHIGGIPGLLEHWDGVPVYAHALEIPFLTGRQEYQEPDSSAEHMSLKHPHDAIDISGVLFRLPEDHTVPHLPGWEWIATPGHSPGHVSFFRHADRALIAGDAFVTVGLDSFYTPLSDCEEVCGPPVYFTSNWNAARESVRLLDTLDPLLVVAGHGKHMEGRELHTGLRRLAAEFDAVARPEVGRYAD